MSQNEELPLTEAELTRALDELRLHGGTVTIGGSRSHTSLGFGTSGWYLAHFDEGAEEVQPTSEETVRRYAASDPQVFRGLLPRPHLRALSAAWRAGDRAAARTHLAAAAAFGDGLGGLALLEASLAPTVTAAQAALIREKLADRTAWHAFMGPVARWERTPATGELGLAFADTLAAHVGEVPGLSLLRASFHGLRGDTTSERMALEAEAAAAPGGPSARRPGAGAAGGGTGLSTKP
ncbi:MAG: hypothetical protein R3F60_06745 [bacterium]